MGARCVFVDGVEFEPLESGNLHFTIITGGERLPFCIERSTTRKALAKATRMLDAADIMQQLRIADMGHSGRHPVEPEVIGSDFATSGPNDSR